ncbi:uncharacterized protein J8A68_005829 [[Candida] subhashii]|uniref:Uncharacterized protein n=1 Tax=[Candida] subhashii TaxID=561895 RepID=A0A8J5QF99_9ASCO|nr:uncharacterized protein J8A68_005829 [[Candida] subhashii]KAG7660712.1 hypothetical protein J8A68_005829 [[Candida] subhashii]
MNNSIRLESNTIDVATLEELRDPNLISRYPPLFNRRQNLISIDSRHKLDNFTNHLPQQSYIKQQETNSGLFKTVPLKPFRSVQSFESTSSSTIQSSKHAKKKRFRLFKFLKGFSRNSEKLQQRESLKQSISSPITNNGRPGGPYPTLALHPPRPSSSSPHSPQARFRSIKPSPGSNNNEIVRSGTIYTNSLYPTRRSNSIKIRQDTLGEINNTRNSLNRRDTYFAQLRDEQINYQAAATTSASAGLLSPMMMPMSAVNTIVIPPIGSNYNHRSLQNPAVYANPIIHPNLHDSEFRRNGGVTFARYDYMNLDPNGMSPDDEEEVEDEVEEEEHNVLYGQIGSSVFLPTTSAYPIPTTSTTSGSNDSFYSILKSPSFDQQSFQERNNNNPKRKASSPIYRITHNYNHHNHSNISSPPDSYYSNVDERLHRGYRR